ncbi:MAG: DNA repair protein RadC [Chitinophagales bacterium]|jgi:DNA repair protein RadC|nr:DNA repair protein RadC [Bacteroidota bacterium]MBK9504882.1 DNA repair protein RadC [Bacteroidota bacterium]MBL0279339.1 DNA repair protein RadC [Bacteroidota bacterium]MBP9880667.1 DNA repair protein RadC [Chitinophagales bacterium]
MEENTGFTLKQLAEEDRPREKLQLKGRQSLTNAELLAILIGSGNAKETAVELSQRILLHYRNNLDVLGRLTIDDLLKFNGIGPAKAITIIAALELGRRRNLAEAEQKVQIKSSRDIYEVMYPLIADLPNEEFWVLHLNKANRIIDKERISIGGIGGTVVDVKIILKSALQKLASAMILVHNHPSGNLTPSDADLSITKKLRDAATYLEIMVLDHVIIGDKNYYSFADNGNI